jgi:RNA polymerase primary sigma factor
VTPAGRNIPRTGEDRSLDTYYREIERYPRITEHEERHLAARVERGDQRALEDLVKANLRFVIHVAKAYRGQGLPMADLINEGNLGLVTAARKFNRKRGCKFITYAIWWIRQNILKALEVQTRTIRVPANVVNDLNRLRKAEASLTQVLDREPTPDEMALEVDIRPEKASRALGAVANTVSLDSTVYREGDVSLNECIADPGASLPDEALHQECLRRDVHDALATLSVRHRQILDLCFGMDGSEPATYQQIGRRLGVSRERVRQLKEDALDKLRRPPYSKRLAEYSS